MCLTQIIPILIFPLSEKSNNVCTVLKGQLSVTLAFSLSFLAFSIATHNNGCWHYFQNTSYIFSLLSASSVTTMVCPSLFLSWKNVSYILKKQEIQLTCSSSLDKEWKVKYFSTTECQKNINGNDTSTLFQLA